VRSKAGIRQLNLPHESKKIKTRKNFFLNRICSEVPVTIRGVSPKEKEGLQREGFVEKEGFKPGVKE